MLKRGMTRRVQAADVLVKVTSFFPVGLRGQGESDEVKRGKVLTNSNNVAEKTDGAKIIGTDAEFLATADDGDNNGHDVAESQEDDTDTDEGIEGSSGTKVDEAEEDLDDHAEHHGVQWDFHFGVNLLPEVGTWDGAITGKGPCAARGSGDASRTADYAEDNEREGEGESTTLVADGGGEDEWEGLASWGCQDISDVRKYKHQGNQEDKATDEVQDDGTNHSFWHLSGWLLNFFAHTKKTPRC